MRGRAATVLAWLAIVATRAAADDIPTVNIGVNGPEQSIPTDHAFFITGDAGKDATAAQAVIVRNGSASLFKGLMHNERCSELATKLHTDKPIDKPLDAGVHKRGEEFPAATEDRDDPVLVSGSWAYTPGGATTYKVLVSADSRFFSAGYTYCLFVLVTKQTQTIDKDTITHYMASLYKAYTQCTRQASEKQVECRNDALTKFENDVGAQLDKAELSPDKTKRTAIRQAVEQAATKALGPAQDLLRDRDTLLKLLQPVPKFASPSRDWFSLPDPFSIAIVTSLTNQGTLFPQQLKTLEHRTKDGAIDVHAVSVLDDDLKIRVASSKDADSKHVRVLDDVNTSNLAISPGVSFADVLALDRATIRGDADVPLSDLVPLLQAMTLDKDWNADDKKKLDSAGKRLGVITDALQMALATKDEPVDKQSQAAVSYQIGLWLTKEKLDPKPFAAIAANLQQLVSLEGQIEQLRPQLQEDVKTQTSVGGPQPIPLSVAFTEKTWVFSYLTPTMGYAQIYGGDDGWFSQFYLAAQIHFWPNPVDVPLWSGGMSRTEDLKRAFAIELGMMPSTSQYGPDNRYRGVFGLPTPFAAVALHPLPYTSVSFGWAFTERRETVLSVEAPSFAPRFYIGLNVQFNIPDLIHQATQQDTATTVDKK